LLAMPMPLVFDTVMVPELVMVPGLVMPVPTALDITMVPELVMLAPGLLRILVDTVTVIPAGMILSSEANGTNVVSQVAAVFQSPSATAVTVAACASGMANTDNAKIRAKTER